MRDIVITALVVAGSLAALRMPWVGIIVWTWLSTMNPHRYSYGFAYDAPFAALAAASTLVGLLMTRDRRSPFRGSPAMWLLVFMIWMTLSWLMGLDVADDFPQWDKVMKVFLMTLVALALLYSKKHIYAFVWVAAGSLALLGVKGGIFTVVNGGNYRVWGPPGTFIGDNNEFALALVMTIPLLRFLQMQLPRGWKRHAMSVVMMLCAAAALGSHSRGALLAISAMALTMWWRGKSRVLGGIGIVVTAAALLMFMPEQWFSRMETIGTYQEDSSALGRISAWWTAWGIAKDYPLGVGFNAARPELFARYSPYPEDVHAAHSIYFQILGNHGFVGLFIFLGLMFATYRAAGRVRKEARVHPAAEWCEALAAMCQVSLIGYFTGGAFLSLAYFDLPYNIMVVVVLMQAWIRERKWESEPVYQPGWRTIPGLASGRSSP